MRFPVPSPRHLNFHWRCIRHLPYRTLRTDWCLPCVSPRPMAQTCRRRGPPGPHSGELYPWKPQTGAPCHALLLAAPTGTDGNGGSLASLQFCHLPFRGHRATTLKQAGGAAGRGVLLAALLLIRRAEVAKQARLQWCQVGLQAKEAERYCVAGLSG